LGDEEEDFTTPGQLVEEVFEVRNQSSGNAGPCRVGVILNAENYEHLVLDPEMKQGRRDHASTSETSHVFPKADLKEVN
jgi:hypothetical protein